MSTMTADIDTNDDAVEVADPTGFGSCALDPPPGHTFSQLAECLHVVQSPAGQRLESDPRPLVDYEKLFTASGAVPTRLSATPARFGVGYKIRLERWNDCSAEVYASDIGAWVEVYIEGKSGCRSK